MRHLWLIILTATAGVSACRTPEQTEARLERKEQMRVEREQRREQARAERAGRAPIEKCSVYVYRKETSFQRGTVAIVYAGEERIGTLTPGQSQCLRLAPGKHTIAVKKPTVFMSGRDLEVEVTGTAPTYVRYLYESDGIAGTAIMVKESLEIVGEELWRERR